MFRCFQECLCSCDVLLKLKSTGIVTNRLIVRERLVILLVSEQVPTSIELVIQYITAYKH